jgi:formylglycine-generating enzyme required for sulfatase activity
LWIETGKRTLPGSPAFVSYAREDAAFALRLAADLKARGANVWIDQLDIRPGRQWDSEVEKALTAASALLVILSPAAVDSRNVMDEIAFALDESKTVIPLMHRECRVPFRLRRLHYIDFKADYQSSLQVLLRELAEGGLIAPVSAEEAVREKADGPEKPTHGEPSPVPAPSVEPKPRQSAGPPFRPSRRILALSAAGLACIVGLGWYVLSRPPGSSPSVPPAANTQTDSARETKVNPKDNLRYVWIPPGQFTMGCSPGDSECYDDEKPAHRVNISHGFWMGQTEVTQAAYKAVTGKPNPSYFKGDDLPVEQVTWQDAKSYCEAVGMRLPTEAEWEYATRAGSTAARDGNLGDVAWYTGNSFGRTHPVAGSSPNAWGLCDMLGNVWEWCGDWYDHYPAESQQDPTGPKSGTRKIVRGGSWGSDPRFVRVSNRLGGEPSNRSVSVGFRCSGELR